MTEDGTDGHDIGVEATRFHRAMRQNVDNALGQFALSGTEYGALHWISRNNSASNSDLARFLIVTPQVLGRLTAQLQARGLIERRPAARGHRYQLTTTAEGDRVLAAARPHVETAQQHLLAPLTATERTELARALTACADHHDQHTNGSS